MLSERTRVRVRAHGKDEDAVAGSKESLGRPKQRGVLFGQLIGQLGEIVIGQTNDQERTGDDIHDLAVFVVQRPVWLHAVELAIIVADDCDGVIPGIHGLDIAADCCLQCFERAFHVDDLRGFLRFDSQDLHGLSPFCMRSRRAGQVRSSCLHPAAPSGRVHTG